MKKLLYIAVAASMLFSCQKENENPFEPGTGIAKGNSTTKLTEKDNGVNMRYYYDNGNIHGHDGVDYGCKGTNGNCLPDLNVPPSDISVIDTLVDESNSGNKSGVIATASRNYNMLEAYFPDQLLNGIINGQLFLKTRGTITGTGNIYFLFKNSSGSIMEVRPLKH